MAKMTKEQYVKYKEEADQSYTGCLKAKMDYINGMIVGNDIKYPTLVELAEKHKVKYTILVRFKRNDRDDWDELRKIVADRACVTAMDSVALSNAKSLEKYYEIAFTKFLPALEKAFERINTDEIKIETIPEMIEALKLATLLREKSAGKDPIALYGARINFIWEQASDKAKVETVIDMGDLNTIETDTDSIKLLS